MLTETTKKSKSRKLVGIVAASALGLGTLGAGLSFVPGVQETISTWTDSETVSAATITNGNLDIEADEANTKWKDISGDLITNPTVIDDISDFRLVPGDTLRKDNGFKIALEGNNLLADLTLSAPGASGETLKDSHGVTLSYAVFKADGSGQPTGDPISVGKATTASSGNAIELGKTVTLDLTPLSEGVKKDVADIPNANYVVAIYVHFDKDTPARELVQKATALKDLTVTLAQKRGGNVDVAVPTEQNVPAKDPTITVP